VCSDKNNRTRPRATDANAGKPGSKRNSHSWAKPRRCYQATAAAGADAKDRDDFLLYRLILPRVPAAALDCGGRPCREKGEHTARSRHSEFAKTLDGTAGLLKCFSVGAVWLLTARAAPDAIR